ncbi:MAG TPA: NUDIX domain-containing protein [Burkholderiales bacterium]|nr:NUDIX domain-containing protein [Burkholderiales bacterium]
MTRAAGAVVFRRTERGVRLLVLRAAASWDFPTGLVQPGEDELAAAQREVRAETGLGDLDFPFGSVHMDTLPTASGKVSSYYLAETEAEDIVLAPSGGRPAHDEWRWVSFDEAEDVLPPRLALVLDWARATLEERA